VLVVGHSALPVFGCQAAAEMVSSISAADCAERISISYRLFSILLKFGEVGHVISTVAEEDVAIDAWPALDQHLSQPTGPAAGSSSQFPDNGSVAGDHRHTESSVAVESVIDVPVITVLRHVRDARTNHREAIDGQHDQHVTISPRRC
jgi:hypothetical protein